MRKGFLIGLLIFYGLIVAGLTGQSYIEPDVKFCHSCHVGKINFTIGFYKGHKSNPPIMLSGKHFAKKKSFALTVIEV